MLIGQELCKALFNDEYQYVLAVHVDHYHIHNHVIVNNVNFYTGKTFETEHNQGKIPERAWSKLRTVSDDLCRKHHLSIVENPEQSKGKSHYEWELDKKNLSWKAQLKAAIDEVIKVSESFEDFLAKCADFGILVEYNPDHKIGLKFMLAEQKERNPRAKNDKGENAGLLLREQADRTAYRELQIPNVAYPESENHKDHIGEISAVSGLAKLGRQGEYESGEQGNKRNDRRYRHP